MWLGCSRLYVLWLFPSGICCAGYTQFRHLSAGFHPDCRLIRSGGTHTIGFITDGVCQVCWSYKLGIMNFATWTRLWFLFFFCCCHLGRGKLLSIFHPPVLVHCPLIKDNEPFSDFAKNFIHFAKPVKGKGKVIRNEKTFSCKLLFLHELLLFSSP